MYIKITKAMQNTYWYYPEYIGKIFKVVDMITTQSGKNFVVDKENDLVTYLVAWDDCIPSSKQEYLEQEE